MCLWGLLYDKSFPFGFMLLCCVCLWPWRPVIYRYALMLPHVGAYHNFYSSDHHRTHTRQQQAPPSLSLLSFVLIAWSLCTVPFTPKLKTPSTTYYSSQALDYHLSMSTDLAGLLSAPPPVHSLQASLDFQAFKSHLNSLVTFYTYNHSHTHTQPYINTAKKAHSEQGSGGERQAGNQRAQVASPTPQWNSPTRHTHTKHPLDEEDQHTQP